MREVREICDRMLDAPAPPMTSPDQLLGKARQARARHRASVGIGLTAAAALLVAASLPWLVTPKAQLALPEPVAPVSGSPAEDLIALVPNGFTAQPSNRVLLTLDIGYAPANGIDVAKDNLQSKVFYLRSVEKVTAPAGDLCAVPMPIRFQFSKPPVNCEVITVNGQEIRTGVYRYDEILNGVTVHYEMQFAIRYTSEKVLMLIQIPDQGTAPLSQRQLAEMVAKLPS